MLKKYDKKTIEIFNEHLCDNYDSYVFENIEYTVDEILLEMNPVEYIKLLDAFISVRDEASTIWNDAINEHLPPF